MVEHQDDRDRQLTILEAAPTVDGRVVVVHTFGSFAVHPADAPAYLAPRAADISTAIPVTESTGKPGAAADAIAEIRIARDRDGTPQVCASSVGPIGSFAIGAWATRASLTRFTAALREAADRLDRAASAVTEPGARPPRLVIEVRAESRGVNLMPTRYAFDVVSDDGGGPPAVSLRHGSHDNPWKGSVVKFAEADGMRDLADALDARTGDLLG